MAGGCCYKILNEHRNKPLIVTLGRICERENNRATLFLPRQDRAPLHRVINIITTSSGTIAKCCLTCPKMLLFFVTCSIVVYRNTWRCGCYETECQFHGDFSEQGIVSLSSGGQRERDCSHKWTGNNVTVLIFSSMDCLATLPQHFYRFSPLAKLFFASILNHLTISRLLSNAKH